MDVAPLLETSDRDELRRWLRKNHRAAREVWVVMFRKNRPAWPALPYVEIVEEALCFGWIDSTNKRLPDGRLAQRISPRRPGGHWTALNLRRFADLVRRRKMTAAGRAAHPGWRETGARPAARVARPHSATAWRGDQRSSRTTRKPTVL